MLMESWVKFVNPQKISGASQRFNILLNNWNGWRLIQLLQRIPSLPKALRSQIDLKRSYSHLDRCSSSWTHFRWGVLLTLLAPQLQLHFWKKKMLLIIFFHIPKPPSSSVVWKNAAVNLQKCFVVFSGFCFFFFFFFLAISEQEGAQHLLWAEFISITSETFCTPELMNEGHRQYRIFTWTHNWNGS